MSMADKIVSRADIDLPAETAGTGSFVLPDLEFDFIEVDHDADQEQGPKQEEEFEFPLFGGAASVENKDTESRGRTAEVQKISLREASVEKIIQSRPQSYYFTKYDDKEKLQIAQVAISGETVISDSRQRDADSHPWRVLNLVEHNLKIDQIAESQKKKKAQRPGKKKRENIIKSRERKRERARADKVIEREAKRKLMKKIHHKRGGKKNKKKTEPTASAQPPKKKYKTE